MKISIIITCYNLGEYLDYAVSNLIPLIKKYSLEILLVNDGSNCKETILKINEIEKKFKDVTIVNQTNQGLGKARNNGIKLAKGNYIIPLDADNRLREDFIKKAIEILDSDKTISVVHGDAEFFGNKQGIWKSKPFDVNEIVLNNYIDACACFRKSSWEIVNGYDEKMPYMGFEDWDLWLRMWNKGLSFCYVNEVFFEYRVRQNSMIDDAWLKRQQLIEYMFNKKELISLSHLRILVIESKELKREPSIKVLLKIFKDKIIRKFNKY